MKYLLDTNTCISILKDKKGMRARVITAGMEDCCISEITLAELYFGAAKSGRASHYADVEFIANHFEVLPIRDTLELFGRNRFLLESQGQRLDDFDLLIGTTALFHNLTIVTHNVKHFDRIPGLKIEDWETA